MSKAFLPGIGFLSKNPFYRKLGLRASLAPPRLVVMSKAFLPGIGFPSKNLFYRKLGLRASLAPPRLVQYPG